MVRFGVLIAFGRFGLFACFNSSMVRFGDDEDEEHLIGVAGFNSSMVRFGATSAAARCFTFDVSIPVWCDLENASGDY